MENIQCANCSCFPSQIQMLDDFICENNHVICRKCLLESQPVCPLCNCSIIHNRTFTSENNTPVIHIGNFDISSAIPELLSDQLENKTSTEDGVFYIDETNNKINTELGNDPRSQEKVKKSYEIDESNKNFESYDRSHKTYDGESKIIYSKNYESQYSSLENVGGNFTGSTNSYILNQQSLENIDFQLSESFGLQKSYSKYKEDENRKINTTKHVTPTLHLERSFNNSPYNSDRSEGDYKNKKSISFIEPKMLSERSKTFTKITLHENKKKNKETSVEANNSQDLKIYCQHCKQAQLTSVLNDQQSNSNNCLNHKAWHDVSPNNYCNGKEIIYTSNNCHNDSFSPVIVKNSSNLSRPNQNIINRKMKRAQIIQQEKEAIRNRIRNEIYSNFPITENNDFNSNSYKYKSNNLNENCDKFVLISLQEQAGSEIKEEIRKIDFELTQKQDVNNIVHSVKQSKLNPSESQSISPKISKESFIKLDCKDNDLNIGDTEDINFDVKVLNQDSEIIGQCNLEKSLNIEPKENLDEIQYDNFEAEPIHDYLKKFILILKKKNPYISKDDIYDIIITLPNTPRNDIERAIEYLKSFDNHPIPPKNTTDIKNSIKTENELEYILFNPCRAINNHSENPLCIPLPQCLPIEMDDKINKCKIKTKSQPAIKLNIDRRPVNCPITSCQREVFISEFTKHIKVDHVKTSIENITPGKYRNIFLDPKQSRCYGVNKCHYLLLVRDKICDFGSHEYKDFLPVLVMSSCISLFDLIYSKPLSNDNNSINSESNLLVIWLTGLITNDLPIYYTLIVWSKNTKAPCHIVQSGKLYSFREDQNAKVLYKTGQAMLLPKERLDLLTDNGKNMLEMQIIIH